MRSSPSGPTNTTPTQIQKAALSARLQLSKLRPGTRVEIAKNFIERFQGLEELGSTLSKIRTQQNQKKLVGHWLDLWIQEERSLEELSGVLKHLHPKNESIPGFIISKIMAGDWAGGAENQITTTLNRMVTYLPKSDKWEAKEGLTAKEFGESIFAKYLSDYAREKIAASAVAT